MVLQLSAGGNTKADVVGAFEGLCISALPPPDPSVPDVPTPTAIRASTLERNFVQQKDRYVTIFRRPSHTPSHNLFNVVPSKSSPIGFAATWPQFSIYLICFLFSREYLAEHMSAPATPAQQEEEEYEYTPFVEALFTR